MLCESCQGKEAKVHLTQVVDGAVKKVHLCEACAAESGFDTHGPVSITDILLGMGGEKTSSVMPVRESTCPQCKMRRADFKKLGRLGCVKCYEVFSDELVPLIKAMHRGEQHVGKIPACESLRAQVSVEIAALQKALSQAISTENYEEAARIRDRIEEWREKMTLKKEASRES